MLVIAVLAVERIVKGTLDDSWVLFAEEDGQGP